MVYWIVNGKEMSDEDHQVYMEQRKAREEAEYQARLKAEQQAREEAARLQRQIGEAYKAYKEFMARHPELSLQVTENQNADRQLYEDLRQNLERADQAPRCTHVKADGRRCGSPRLKSGDFCYTHQRLAEATSVQLSLSMEDPNAIQLSLQQVCKALLEGRITDKMAGRLLSALRTAASNVDRVTFHEQPDEMVTDEPVKKPAPKEPHPDDDYYKDLDQDLRDRAKEIELEWDRRRAAKVTRAREEEELRRANQESLTTEGTEEHGGVAEARRNQESGSVASADASGFYMRTETGITATQPSSRS